MRASVVTPVVMVALAGLVAPAAAEPSGRVVGAVKVSEADGKPVTGANVVVYIVGFAEPPRDRRTTIEQRDRRFIPDLVAITVNEHIEFPNNDPFLHNVFSQSGPREFDLGSFKRGETKDKRFPTPGVVDVYCNIHPEMAATILVLPNRRHTMVKPDGRYALDGVPPGDWTVFAYTRRAIRPASAKVTVKPGEDATIELAIVRGPEPAHLNKYGEKYHDVRHVYR